MTDGVGAWRLVSAVRNRILLICPTCGRQHLEFANRLRGLRLYCCKRDGCDYLFDLTAPPSSRYVLDIVGAWRRLCAAFAPMRRAGSAGDIAEIT
jgi:hypothetical protein